MTDRRRGRMLLAAACLTLAAPAASKTTRACPAGDGISFLCGLRNAEDIVAIPGSDLLVGSSSRGNGNPDGALFLIDTRARTSARLVPDWGGTPLPAYAACPGAPDSAHFNPHGIALRQSADGSHLLYVVNHGGREAIELFTLTTRGANASARWAGCVVLPEGASGNGVAPLADGGFAATQFFDTRRGDMITQLVELQKTGAAYLWHPGRGFSTIPGSAHSGDNGIDVSVDGKWLFVAMWPEKRIVRFALAGDAPPVSIPLDFMPDNIHRAADGSLLIGGHATDIRALISCGAPPCPVDWAIARLDPATMRLTSVRREKGTPSFGGATGAAEANGALWIGTARGDRIAILPLR